MNLILSTWFLMNLLMCGFAATATFLDLPMPSEVDTFFYKELAAISFLPFDFLFKTKDLFSFMLDSL